MAEKYFNKVQVAKFFHFCHDWGGPIPEFSRILSAVAGFGGCRFSALEMSSDQMAGLDGGFHSVVAQKATEILAAKSQWIASPDQWHEIVSILSTELVVSCVAVVGDCA
jgi:hypothetical protein